MVIKGVGLGLRPQHLPEILGEKPDVPWFEILIDNYFCEGGLSLHNLELVRQNYPIVFHSVGMSIAGTDPLDLNWYKKLKELIDRFQPEWISDHLCWSQHGKHHLHDLLPLPFTEKNLDHVVDRINQVQDVLKQKILIENVSSYINFSESTMSEAEFLVETINKSGCDLLLDVNNIYVSASNNKFDPESYIDIIPKEKVKQMHLAGYEDNGSILLDTHGAPIWEPVWELYAKVISKFGSVPTLIEWDNEIPDFKILTEEARKAQAIMNGEKHES